MTSYDDFDRRLTAWLEDVAPPREPEHLLEVVLDRTARTPRRPAWRIPERWIPMSTITSTASSATRVPLRTVGLVALLLLALAIGAMVLVGSQRQTLPAPFGPAVNGQILTVEGGDILVRDTVTDEARPLISDAAEDVGPWPSRDGTQFTFFRITQDGVDLWIADIDGSRQRRLAGPYVEPAGIDWSPTGDAVIINEFPTTDDAEARTDGQLWLVDTDDGTSTRLDVGMSATTPSFRPPDGATLSFVGQHPIDGLGLYLVGRDGTGLQRLGLEPFDDTDPTAAYLDGHSWSPGGDRVVFHSRDVSPGSPSGRSIRIKVADVGPAGDVIRETMLPDDLESHSEFGAEWLPTGDQIVYHRLVNQMPRLTIAVPGDEASRRDLAKGPVIFLIAIAPDGASLLYGADGGRIWEVDVESGDAHETGIGTDDIVVWQRTGGD